jgi:hypothetical protein
MAVTSRSIRPKAESQTTSFSNKYITQARVYVACTFLYSRHHARLSMVPLKQDETWRPIVIAKRQRRQNPTFLALNARIKHNAECWHYANFRSEKKQPRTFPIKFQIFL